MDTIYLLHFSRPYKHAKHYLGAVDGGADELTKRLDAHNRGAGARLTAVVRAAGVNLILARTWDNVPRGTERKLKKQGGASRLCPICKKEAA